MATLEGIIQSVRSIIQDAHAYPENDLVARINEAQAAIAAGIMLPDRGSLTPPLPELFKTETRDTVSDQPWLNMPDDYQRDLERVGGQSMWGIKPPRGGDFYSFNLFMQQVYRDDLGEPGPVYMACLRGRRLYYQGVPQEPETLTLAYYRRPEKMAALTDVPEGIPEHIQRRLLTHYVCAEVFGEGIEDGENSAGTGAQYHRARFLEAAEALFRFLPEDKAPFNVPGDEDVALRY